MGLIITTPKLTAGVTTYGVFLRKRSDGTIWRPGTGWVASCTNAQAFVALAELTAQFAGIYSVDVAGLGDALWVEALTVNSADGYNVVLGTGLGSAYVVGGLEVDPSQADLMEAGVTFKQAVQRIGAVAAGLLPTGAGSGTETFLGLDGVTPRVEFTVDEDGNRTAVDYDP